MCFSAEADFATGAVIGAVGVLTLTKVEHPRELALASLPLALAAHQVVEGFVWLGHEGHASQSLSDLATYLYVAFAWVVLPVFFPLCMWLVEPLRQRRRAMAPFLALGGVVGAYLLWSIIYNDVTAHAVHHTIQYGGAGDYAVPATVLYVVATCVPPLLSSFLEVRLFGAANLAAVGVIAWAQADGLTSVWCVWAAVISVLIYAQFVVWRRATPARAAPRGEPVPASAPSSPTPASRTPR